MWKGTIEKHGNCQAGGTEIQLPGYSNPVLEVNGNRFVIIRSCIIGTCDQMYLRVDNVHDTSAKDSTTPS